MNFMIIGSPRTGSTHLVSLLNLQNDILCNGEIFLSRQGKVQVRWESDDKDSGAIAELVSLRRRNPKAFLDRIFAQNYGCGSVGFKIFPGQNDVMLEGLILDGSIKKIVLMRRNVLAVYSSALIARETGTRTSKSGTAELELKPKVEFRAIGFRRYCERYMAYYRSVFDRLNQANEVFHLVNYDQINDPWHFASLVTFIGAALTDAQPTAKLAKLNPSDILSRFSNPDAAESFLHEHALTEWQYESETLLDPFGTAKQTPSGEGSLEDTSELSDQE